MTNTPQMNPGGTETEVAPSRIAPAKCLHQLFEEQACYHPDRVAFSLGKTGIRYRVLNERANRLARRLSQDFGLGSGQVAGIVLDSTLDAPIGTLAILKTGAAYLPIDAKTDKETINYMLKESGATLLLDKDLERAESLFFSGKIVDPTEPFADDVDTGDLNRSVRSIEPAYVIHSLDTLGSRESISVTHREASSMGLALDKFLKSDASGEWLCVSDQNFDMPVFEQLWALSRGLSIVTRRTEDLLPDTRLSNPFTEGKDTPLVSLFYWGSSDVSSARYELLIEGCKFADEAGLHAIWTPERHFHEFGGNFPNPSVTSAAIAMMTKNVRIRAGSVVLPLQEPIRVAEEWSVVDNLSNGRVGIAFASGWASTDFALAPEKHKNRKEVMMEGIDEFQRLWRGESVTRKTPSGEPIELKVYPRPKQADGIPIWLTAAGNPDTFKTAGERGFGVLTLLQGQDLETLAEKIAVYREAWASNPANKGRGHVTLLLHTYLAEDREAAKEAVKGPLCEYLKSYIGLAKTLQSKDSAAMKAFEMDPTMEKTILERAFARYFESCGLLGSIPDALKMMEVLSDEDIDEVGCLIDFGLSNEQVFQGFKYLKQFKVANDVRMSRRRAERSLAGLMQKGQVAGIRCGAGFLDTLAEQNDGAQSLAKLGRVACADERLGAASRQGLESAGIAVSSLASLGTDLRPVGEGMARCYAPRPSAEKNSPPSASESPDRAGSRRPQSGRDRPVRKNALRRN